ncbi:GNAT family N-acetyltransferase [Phycicoccus sp. CSK15P-2]|uniref:GNAT family N-acetyltransferase n=1 Tax=Phycicoccus sp. CSK15P-2 TaxID=2807627 RepID=UPI00194F578B|nr:GNAT family N-acetyltransferase [Phycicoccus sp. CSK15P-2]MBM6405938.1 GNAT family N-acetyltransferase [Phycicoccus sp. CSK15P-2]
MALSATEADDAVWDRRNGRHFYTGSAWLRAFAELAGLSFVRVDGVAASAVGHRVHADRTNPRYTHRVLYDDALLEPVGDYGLVGGCAGYEGHLPREDVATADDERAVVRRLASQLGTEVLLAAHLPEDEARRVVEHEVLPGAATPVLGMVVAELDLAGASTFEDYVAGLSRNARSVVRRDLRRAQTAGLRTEVGPLAPVVAEVAPLLGQVQGHHGDDPDPEAAAAYLRLCCHGSLADAALAFVTRDAGGRAVAFSLGYSWHDTVFMRVAGLDYTRAGESGAYFESYFYAPVRHALDTGRVRVDFGGESLESKLRRGARPQARWSLSVGAAVDADRAREVTARRVASLPSGRGPAPGSAGWLEVHDALTGTAAGRAWHPMGAGR